MSPAAAAHPTRSSPGHRLKRTCTPINQAQRGPQKQLKPRLSLRKTETPLPNLSHNSPGLPAALGATGPRRNRNTPPHTQSPAPPPAPQPPPPHSHGPIAEALEDGERGVVAALLQEGIGGAEQRAERVPAAAGHGAPPAATGLGCTHRARFRGRGPAHRSYRLSQLSIGALDQ